MSAKTEMAVKVAGLIIIATAILYAFITGDVSKFNNTYLG